MDHLYPPIKRAAVVKNLPRPHIPRSLKLLLVLDSTLIGFGAFLDARRLLPLNGIHTGQSHKPKEAAPHPHQILPAHSQTESIFIDALVQASTCHNVTASQSQPQSKSQSPHTYHKFRRRNALAARQQTRCIHQSPNNRPAITRTSPSREEYLNLVDTYRELYSTQAQWMEPTPPLPTPLVSSLLPTKRAPLPVIELSSDLGRPPDQHHPGGDMQLKLGHVEKETTGEQQRPDVSNLLRVLERSDCDHDAAHEAYSMLPSPGIIYLSEEQIRLLFRRLSTMKKKDPKAAMRYLSVVDEMKSQNLPMIQGEWNSAIAFCGQCFAKIGTREVEDALLTWKELENEANIKSNNVTFNILFDIAAKAGKFVLADMILKEMERRGLEYNRFFRVGNIYFHGLKGDGDGVRRAYSELVEAGEIVDTVVMNCVITALISAGELASAENVYERMKRLVSTHAGALLPKERTWQEERDLGRILDRVARNIQDVQTKKDQARVWALKSRISILPNIQTFTIFIEHHASHTGDLHRIAAILSEMQILGATINGRVFLKIFKGFSNHGQEPLTAWTLERLKKVWDSLLAALEGEKDDVRIEKWLVIWVVRAFHQCGGRDWALHVWEEFRARQKPELDDLQSTHAALSNILKLDQSRSGLDSTSLWSG